MRMKSPWNGRAVGRGAFTPKESVNHEWTRINTNGADTSTPKRLRICSSAAGARPSGRFTVCAVQPPR